MASLRFLDTHNMVAYLSKPTESEGFDQIVDFLNAHPIRYALTVNPTIFVSCIEQFWSSAKTKTVNEEVQIHAKVDGKRIIITESSVRRNLRIVDREGIDCLSTSTICENLTLMGVQVLRQLLGMIRNLDSSGKFLMYPRFMQLFLDNQLDELPTHKRKYISPAHTKKIFANIRRAGKDFSGRVTALFSIMVVQNQQTQGEGSTIPVETHQTPIFAQSSSHQPISQTYRRKTRKDTQIPQSSVPTITPIADEAINEEMYNSLVRAATTDTGLDAGQDSGNIDKTQSKVTPNESSSHGADSGGGPRCYFTKGDTSAQARPEAVSRPSNDSLTRGNTLGSDKDRLKVTKLMETCTNLQRKVLDLETNLELTKTSHKKEIAILEKRIMKLEKRNRSRTYKLKRLYKVGLTARVESSELNDDVNVNDVDDVADDVVMEANVAENVVEDVVDVISTAKVLVDSSKVNTCEVRVSTTSDIVSTASRRVSTTGEEVSTVSEKVSAAFEKVSTADDNINTAYVQTQLSKDKGKGILVEEPKVLKKKHQILQDEEDARRLQAQYDEEDRIARELQAEEREGLTDAEKASHLMQFIESRKKFFAAKRTEEKRNKPPTQAQQRKLISFKRVNTFVDMDTELVGTSQQRTNKQTTKTVQESFKRAGDEMEPEQTKKQKIDEDKEQTELKRLTEANSDECKVPTANTQLLLLVNISAAEGVNTARLKLVLLIQVNAAELIKTEMREIWPFLRKKVKSGAAVGKLVLLKIIMANLPPPNNDPNVPEEEPIPEQAHAALVGFAPQWIGGKIPNNNNGWLEEDDEDDPEEDDDEDPEKDEVDKDNEDDPGEDDDEEPEEDKVGDGEEEEMEIDDEVDNPKVSDPNEPPPPGFQFGHNFHVGESSSTRALLDGNSEVFAPGPKPSDLMTIHKRTTKLEKQMFEMYNTKIKIKEKFKEDDLRMNRHELDVTTKYSKMMRSCIPKRLRFQEEPPIPSAFAPRSDNPYVMARDAAMAAQEDDDDDASAAKDPQPLETMPPKRRSQTNPQPTLTQEGNDQLVREGIEAIIRAEQERVRIEATIAGGPAGGPTAALVA
ncbi:hypothetical protein Tco_1334709 [Tanacetum coccineum]